MKRIVIMIVAITFIAAPLFAAAITDSVKPLGHLKYSLTAEDNYIFKRDIKTSENNTSFKTEDINQVYAKLALGVTPYFNLYGKLGASDGGTIKDTNTASNGVEAKIETNYGFLWGVGLSGAKEISNGWKLGADAQFDWWRPDVDSVTSVARSTSSSGKIEDFEFQITPFITKQFELPYGKVGSQYKWVADPYLGLKYSYFKTQTDKNIQYMAAGTNSTTSWTLRGKDSLGIVVGSDLVFADKWALELEGRFIDETAITAGVAYRF